MRQGLAAMTVAETRSVGARARFGTGFNAKYADGACFIYGVSYEIESE
jgi:hypothetical protein